MQMRQAQLCRTLCTLCAVASGCVGVSTVPSAAEVAAFNLTCGRADVMNPKWNVPMTFSYSGIDKTPVKVGGPFGEFSVDVRRIDLPRHDVTTGEALVGTSDAHIKLPIFADLEACIAKSRDPAAKPDDQDALLNARDECLRQLEPSGEGVDASAALMIGFMKDNGDNSGEDAFVDLKFTYRASNQSSKGLTSVQPFPANCALKK